MASYTLDYAFGGQPFVQDGTGLNSLDYAFGGQPFAASSQLGTTFTKSLTTTVGTTATIGQLVDYTSIIPGSLAGQAGTTARFVKLVGKILKAQ